MQISVLQGRRLYNFMGMIFGGIVVFHFLLCILFKIWFQILAIFVCGTYVHYKTSIRTIKANIHSLSISWTSFVHELAVNEGNSVGMVMRMCVYHHDLSLFLRIGGGSGGGGGGTGGTCPPLNFRWGGIIPPKFQLFCLFFCFFVCLSPGGRCCVPRVPLPNNVNDVRKLSGKKMDGSPPPPP